MYALILYRRTTATAKNNQYELLEDIFSGNLSKLTKYEEWKNITLRQLNIDNGHRKEDMIIKLVYLNVYFYIQLNQPNNKYENSDLF